MQKTVHRAPILRRSRPLRTLEAQNSNHYTSRTGIKRCARANTRHPLRTLMRGRGNQGQGVLQYSTSGRPDLGVYASRFEGRNMGRGPLAS